ncbi:MAG: dephospho-CoA kinase [Verrucomicrobia bacterium]|nr:dephospho-CoA kinase [Verrucomicrobiota bacterium]
MPSIAITGSIGSGKSLALKLIAQLLPSDIYNADLENRKLLDHDEEVRELIRKAFGEACFDSMGCPDRKHLFELITSDQSAKTLLEGILHPRLEKVWKPLALASKGTKGDFFIAEIPLLYEKGLENFFDRVILVACSDSVRKERLKLNRRLSHTETSAWLKNQTAQEQKVLLSDHLLWNDSSTSALELQIHHLIPLLKNL